MSTPNSPGVRSVRRRALLPTLLIIASLVYISAVVLSDLAATMRQQRLLARSRMLGHIVARSAVTLTRQDELEAMLRAVGAEDEVARVLVVAGRPPRVLAADTAGWRDRPLAEIDAPREESELVAAMDTGREQRAPGTTSDQILYVVPFRTAAGAPGAALVHVDGHSIHTQTDGWTRSLSLMLLALFALGFGSAEWLLRRHVLRPVRAVTDAAARRGAGDRDARAAVHSDDELGLLARTVNEAFAGTDRALHELELQMFALDQAALVMITDGERAITHVNDAFCALSGFAREELLGRNSHVLISGGADDAEANARADWVRAGHVWRGEIAARRRDGEPYWVAATLIPSRDEAGRVTRCITIMFDVTQRKLTEIALGAAERRFREAADSAPVLIWLADESGACTFFNQGWLVFTGRTFEQELGAGWTAGVHPDDLPHCHALCATHMAARDAFEMEYRLRRADGEYRSLLVSAAPLWNGEEFCGYIGTCIDLTERLLAERKLRESEARTRQIVETSLDAVIGIDTDGIVTGWNRQATQLFGWESAEALGQPLGDLIVPPQFRRAHERGMQRFLQTGEGPMIGQRVEFTALRRGGEEFPIELAVTALPAESGLAFSAFIRDISERKRAEADIVRARDAAQKANRAKSDFLATMSHEIRTPMNGVLGFTDLLLETGLDPVQREYAATIRDSGQVLLALINDILDFSKIEAGRLDVEREPFDARRAAADVVELLSAKAEERTLELVFEWDPAVPRDLLGDPMRFRQVLLNLAGNAIKFTESGAVTVRVEREGDGYLRVMVQDTGIGIAEEKLAHLFRKFTQADSSTTRRFGGTGLGLAISKQLVELMGGQIGVDSHAGQGSTFWFTLPLSPEPAHAPAAPDCAGLEGVRALVVDDLETNRRVLCAPLARWGMHADAASSGAEALDRLRAAVAAGAPYRVALLDLQMPGMDGETLARAIAEDPSTGRPALVLLTSGSYRNERGYFLALGFADVLLKPIVRIETLRVALARIVGQDAARATAAPAGAAAPAVTDEPGAAAAAPARASIAGRRVLLAEDQPVNQKLAVRVLARFGCVVDVAANGREACAFVEAHDYDLVFMDCHMPEMDGFEATAEIRSREAAERDRGGAVRHVPIIALTASVLKADRDRCFHSGMDDFISKPFRPDQIEDAVRRWGAPPADAAAGDGEAAAA